MAAGGTIHHEHRADVPSTATAAAEETSEGTRSRRVQRAPRHASAHPPSGMPSPPLPPSTMGYFATDSWRTSPEASTTSARTGRAEVQAEEERVVGGGGGGEAAAAAAAAAEEVMVRVGTRGRRMWSGASRGARRGSRVRVDGETTRDRGGDGVPREGTGGGARAARREVGADRGR